MLAPSAALRSMNCPMSRCSLCVSDRSAAMVSCRHCTCRSPDLDKVVLITGGGRGIGAATALLAAQRGYAVAVNYASNSLAADEVVRGIRAAGGTALAVQADVADEAQVQTMFQ